MHKLSNWAGNQIATEFSSCTDEKIARTAVECPTPKTICNFSGILDEVLDIKTNPCKVLLSIRIRFKTTENMSKPTHALKTRNDKGRVACIGDSIVNSQESGCVFIDAWMSPSIE